MCELERCATRERTKLQRIGVREIGGRDEGSVSAYKARAGDEMAVDTAKEAGKRARVRERTGAQRDVATFGDEVDEPIVGDELDVDVRIAAEKRRDHRSEKLEVQRRRDAESTSRFALQLGHGELGLLDLGHNTRGMAVVGLAGVCQAQTPCRALKQTGSKPCFEGRHFAADRRLGHVQTTAGSDETAGLDDAHEQASLVTEARRGRLQLIVSPHGERNSLSIHQDTRIFAARLEAGDEVIHRIEAERHVWIQVARGRVRANDIELGEGDGLSWSGAGEVAMTGADAEIVMFDLS